MCSRKCWIVSFFYFFLHLPHRQFSFIDLCLSSKMYWTFNCSWDNVMKWNVFFFCVLHIFQNFPCTLGEKSKSVSFSRVYVCVKAKLTLVSFFLLFFLCTFPLLSPSGDLGISLVRRNRTPPTFWSDCWNPLQSELNYLWGVLSCSQDDIRWFSD